MRVMAAEPWYRRGARGAVAGALATVTMSVVQFPGVSVAGEYPPPIEVTRRLQPWWRQRPAARFSLLARGIALHLAFGVSCGAVYAMVAPRRLREFSVTRARCGPIRRELPRLPPGGRTSSAQRERRPPSPGRRTSLGTWSTASYSLSSYAGQTRELVSKTRRDAQSRRRTRWCPAAPDPVRTRFAGRSRRCSLRRLAPRPAPGDRTRVGVIQPRGNPPRQSRSPAQRAASHVGVRFVDTLIAPVSTRSSVTRSTEGLRARVLGVIGGLVTALSSPDVGGEHNFSRAVLDGRDGRG